MATPSAARCLFFTQRRKTDATRRACRLQGLGGMALEMNDARGDAWTATARGRPGRLASSSAPGRTSRAATSSLQPRRPATTSRACDESGVGSRSGDTLGALLCADGMIEIRIPDTPAALADDSDGDPGTRDAPGAVALEAVPGDAYALRKCINADPLDILAQEHVGAYTPWRCKTSTEFWPPRCVIGILQ